MWSTAGRSRLKNRSFCDMARLWPRQTAHGWRLVAGVEVEMEMVTTTALAKADGDAFIVWARNFTHPSLLHMQRPPARADMSH